MKNATNFISGILVGSIIPCVFILSSNKAVSTDYTPVYNSIRDTNLIACIESYVHKCKDMEIDSSKYLRLSFTNKYRGDTTVFSLSYYNNENHVDNNLTPIIICAPIAGKKILVEDRDLVGFVWANYYEKAEYFRYDLPYQYQKFKDKIEDERLNKKGRQILRWTQSHGSPTLVIKYIGKEYINSEYHYDL